MTPEREYRQSSERKALVYIRGVAHDVLVLRETRGRYQVRLPHGVTTEIRFRSGARMIVLRPGCTTSVPISAVELR